MWWHMASDTLNLSDAAVELLYDIGRDVRRCCRPDDDSLPHAASDVMDGSKWSRDPEVAELIGMGLIEKVRDACGTTWHLTARGCDLFRPLVDRTWTVRVDRLRRAIELFGSAPLDNKERFAVESLLKLAEV